MDDLYSVLNTQLTDTINEINKPKMDALCGRQSVGFVAMDAWGSLVAARRATSLVRAAEFRARTTRTSTLKERLAFF